VPLLDAAIHAGTKLPAEPADQKPKFPDRFQDSGLDRSRNPYFRPHYRRRFAFPYDRSDDGGFTPLFGRSSVSPASPRIISFEGAVRGTFQRGVFTTEDILLKLNCLFPVPTHAGKREARMLQTSQDQLAEPNKYNNHKSMTSTAFRTHLTFE